MIRHRRQIRLKNYDYTKSGYYFVTICTNFKEMLFGKIIDGVMILNDYGKIVRQKWYDLPNHNSNIKLDELIIMPNHIHGIIIIENTDVGAGSQPAPLISKTGYDNHPKLILGTQTEIKNQIKTNTDTIDVGAGSQPAPTTTTNHGLPEIVRQLKTFSSKQINELRNTTGTTVWQRNYYEHIIRNEKELWKIRQYIRYNPKNWESDEYNANN